MQSDFHHIILHHIPLISDRYNHVFCRKTLWSDFFQTIGSTNRQTVEQMNWRTIGVSYYIYISSRPWSNMWEWLSWSWWYDSWIYNFLSNQCLSPLKFWVRTPSWRGVLDTTLRDKVWQWLATGQWFSPGTPVSSTNKTNHHDITEILLKVALNTINQYKPKWLHFQCNLISII
jgi:hypothetical protein